MWNKNYVIIRILYISFIYFFPIFVLNSKTPQHDTNQTDPNPTQPQSNNTQSKYQTDRLDHNMKP